ncbi:MAG: 3-phosphoshikimate 1-carboxyvinyltransferase [Planctomycetota bacterium]|jgi:3-phosphoshikimate 1-carboxyvinyltransferase|nr:3-phosphoshikimate 1-carboxyvinyltransferase [Planctomycetota bacterium]
MPAAADYPPRLRLGPVRRPPAGDIAVPGSKSLANRAILLAGIARGESRLSGLPDSGDVQAALGALAGLGIPCRREGEVLIVQGRGLDFPRRGGEIPIGSSGTVGRFLPGLLAAAPAAGPWRLTASPQLAGRPLRPLLDALRQWGGEAAAETPGKSFPLLVSGGGLSGGAAAVSAAASSQFASGLLLAAPLCRRPAELAIRDLDPDETYLELTREAMRLFGVSAALSRSGAEVLARVDAPGFYRPAEIGMEADFNTALYFLSLAALTGGRIGVVNLNPASRQPGAKFLSVLSRLGCRVEASSGGILAEGGSLPLRGGFSLDMRAMSEMAVTLGVLAVFAHRPIRLFNLGHIRGHESDRLAALADLLGRTGAGTEETPDGITVHPLARHKIRRVRIDPRDDHRLAMSFALLGAAANGIELENPGCVAKTCPEFFRLLAGLGVPVEPLS